MAKQSNGNGTAVIDLQAAQAEAEAAAARLAQAQAQALKSAQDQLAQIDAQREACVAQIAALGGKATRKRGAGRPKGQGTGGNARSQNSTPLHMVVAGVLSKANGPLSPTEVVEGVTKAGYTTNSDNLPTMVSQQLGRLARLRMGKSPVAVNASRGEWTAGSGMAKYLANPDAATEIEKD